MPPPPSQALRVAIPFTTPVYGHVNGGHPLISQLIADGRPGLRFLPAPYEAPTLAGVAAALADAQALGERLTAPGGGPPTDADAVEAYLHSRDLASQALTPRDADLAFLHTAPLTVDALPWVLHFESVATLFWPFLHQGRCRDLPLFRQPIYPIVTRLLESASARALFTHSRRSVEQIGRIFPESVAAKVRYAPLGIHIPQPWPDRIAAAADGRNEERRPVELLFTNSWHQAPENFYNRGGVDVVEAFLALHREFPDVHLTLRTALPDDLRAGPLGRAILEHPAITLIDQPISEDALHRLLLAADVFLLPSASLHSVSLLRAMAFGAVPVVSDIPLMQEFIDDGRTGVVIGGRAQTVLSVDPESGWEQEDYAAMRGCNRHVTDGIVAALLDLCRAPERRAALARAAQAAIAERFAFERFRQAFEDVLHEAAPVAAAPPPPPSLAARLAARLQPALSLHRHPVAETEPVAMSPYRDFNVVWFQGRIYGVRQGSGDIDLTAPMETLRQRLGPDDLIVAETAAELYARIDGATAITQAQQALTALNDLEQRVNRIAFGPAGDPNVVHPAGEYGGYNLVWRHGRVYALRQGVEFPPLETLCSEQLSAAIKVEDLLIADSVDAAAALIDIKDVEKDASSLTTAVAELGRRLDVLAFGPAGDPAATVEAGEYAGFNLMWRGGRVLALRQGVEGLSPDLPAAVMAEHLDCGDVIVSESVEQAMTVIDLAESEAEALALTARLATLEKTVYGASGAPQDARIAIAVGAHGGFNLFRYGEKVAAVRQSAGAFDPSIGLDALCRQFSGDDVIVTSNEEVTRCRIDLLNLESRRLSNRLRRRFLR